MNVTDPEDVVAAFIAAIEAQDIDAAIELLAGAQRREPYPATREPARAVPAPQEAGS